MRGFIFMIWLGIQLQAGDLSLDAAPSDLRRSWGQAGSPVDLKTFQLGPHTAYVWEVTGAKGESTWQYAIRRANGELGRIRNITYEIALAHGDWDPLETHPPVMFSKGRSGNIHIVQTFTPPDAHCQGAVENLGGQVLRYAPRHALLVEMTPDVRDQVARLPFVRWVGPYVSTMRLDPAGRAWVQKGDPTVRRSVIMTFRPRDKDLVARKLTEIGALHVKDGGKLLLQAGLNGSQLAQASTWDQVCFIQEWTPVEPDMTLVRESVGANFIETVAGYTGAGVSGEVLDIRFNPTHVDLQSRPPLEHTAITAIGSHGAATSGILFGDGTGNPDARGLLPQGQPILAVWGEVSNRYSHTAELLEPPYRAVFQSCSLGSPRTTFYTVESSELDGIIFDLDLLHCQSQGAGPGAQSRPEAWAKNVVSVSGTQHQNTLDRSDDCWCDFASTGPAEDGRIKPDFTHYLDDIFTLSDGGPAAYASFSGTTAATPIVCGAFGLFFQMWNDGLFGNPVNPKGDVFSNRPHASTARAMMINSANPYPFSGTGHDLTRVHQGWGFPDLQQLYNWRENLMVVDETDLITHLQTREYRVQIPNGAERFRATLVFADPPAIPFAGVHRINDLTLRVTSSQGIVYWGNAGLLEGNESQPGGAADHGSTVENVWISNPSAGEWLIEVIADEIVEDGHVETPEMDADFALVISGLSTMPTLSSLIAQWPHEATILDMIPLLPHDGVSQ